MAFEDPSFHELAFLFSYPLLSTKTAYSFNHFLWRTFLRHSCAKYTHYRSSSIYQVSTPFRGSLFRSVSLVIESSKRAPPPDNAFELRQQSRQTSISTSWRTRPQLRYHGLDGNITFITLSQGHDRASSAWWQRDIISTFAICSAINIRSTFSNLHTNIFSTGLYPPNFLNPHNDFQDVGLGYR